VKIVSYIEELFGFLFIAMQYHETIISYHNKHVFSGFIKGQTIRHIKNTDNGDNLHDIISKFRKWLIDRGYRESEIEKKKLIYSTE
jgi:hypothetical protein